MQDEAARSSAAIIVPLIIGGVVACVVAVLWPHALSAVGLVAGLTALAAGSRLVKMIGLAIAVFGAAGLALGLR